ncbi:MAG: hypothetical protein ACXACK_07785 [Candidatus Hodarchaeales archaeon]|jgi:hypothetical protein
MEIQYQNKFVITWCLDREGPRICLKAETRENEDKTIEIISENFVLEFEEKEAREFLNILNRLTFEEPIYATPEPVPEPEPEPIAFEEPIYATPEPVPEPEPEPIAFEEPIHTTPEPVPEPEPEPIAFEEPIHATPEPVPEPELIAFEEPIHATPEPVPEPEPIAFEEPIHATPEPVPEPELIAFEEPIHATPEPVPEPEPIAFEEPIHTTPEPAPEPELKVTEIPDPSEIVEVLKQSEKTYHDTQPEITEKILFDDLSQSTPSEWNEEENNQVISMINDKSQQFDDSFDVEIDTASFFQKTEPKSPLEKLLEEKEDEKTTLVNIKENENLHPQAEEGSEKPSEPLTSFTPDDLKTEAFFSKFDARSTLELLKTVKPKPTANESLDSSSEPEYKRVVKLKPVPKPSEKEEYLTEAERRAAMEKERAERRRRLWELTRGF